MGCHNGLLLLDDRLGCCSRWLNFAYGLQSFRQCSCESTHSLHLSVLGCFGQSHDAVYIVEGYAPYLVKVEVVVDVGIASRSSDELRECMVHHAVILDTNEMSHTKTKPNIFKETITIVPLPATPLDQTCSLFRAESLHAVVECNLKIRVQYTSLYGVHLCWPLHRKISQ